MRLILIPVFLFFRVNGLLAQQAADPHVHDLRIERFFEKDQRDSFLFYLTEKIRLARQADSLALWGWAQIEQHDWYAEQGESTTALQILDAAWQQHWREPRNAEEWEPFLYLHQNRGWCLFESGKVWQAVQAYEQAAALYERYHYPDFDPVESVYKPLGAHYTRLGDNEKALVALEKALAAGHTDRETLAGVYLNTGLACWNKGDATLACKHFRTGLDLRDVSSLRRAALLSGLAQATLDLPVRDSENGIQHAKEAYGLALQALQCTKNAPAGDPQLTVWRAAIRHTAGLAAFRTGNHAAAQKWLDEALADARKAFGPVSRDVGKIQVSRSALLRTRGRPEAALAASNEALKAVLPVFRPKTLSENPDPGSFYEENVIFEALEAKALAAEALFSKPSDTIWLSRALACHDLAWQASVRLRRIQQYNSSKLDLQTGTRTRDIAAMRVARRLYEQSGQNQYAAKAFAIAERSKAALLLEATRENLLRRSAGGDARFAELDGLRRSLAYFERNLILEPGSDKAPQWRVEADAIGSRIALLEREMALTPASGPVPVTSALPGRAELAPDETLLAYFAAENTLDVFVIREGRVVAWHSLASDNTSARRFLAFFENSAAILNDPSGYLHTAFELWQKIIPPEARDARRLLVIPDGFLNFIPFEALVTEAPGPQTSLRNASYLIVGQELRYAWSLAVLRQQQALQSGAEKEMLVLAPGFANSERGLAPLSADGLKWSAGRSDCRVLSGPEASLANCLAEAGRYRLLHFSTHAFADELPRIELIDQPLLLSDIYALALNADLVVLGACQTGLGREYRGEGVMSLARTFARAGAASVLSGLWSVNDRSTAYVMEAFYLNLEKGQAASEALRLAKLAYLQDPGTGAARQSPYFWAGLVLVGANRDLAMTEKKSPLPLALQYGSGVAILGLAFWWLWRRRKKGMFTRK